MIVTAVVLAAGLIAGASWVIITGGPLVALVSMLVASVSVPAILSVVLWLDRYEPEPSHYLVAALGWGALGATVIALAVELTVTDAGVDPALSSAVFAPVIEELAKGLFLLALFVFRRRQFDGILDGVVYGALVGLGFAFAENIVYYQQSYLQGGSSYLASTFLLRGVFGPFAHPMFTALVGIGVGVAVVARRRRTKIIGAAGGLVAGVALHVAWNASSVYGGFDGYLVTYLIGMLPAIAVITGLAVWARRREADVLASALELCVGRGWIAAETVTWVALLPNRMAARRWARERSGRPAARLVRDYQQTLTELAFLHWRISWGAPLAPLRQRMGEVATHATALAPWIVWPPASVAERLQVDHAFAERLTELGAEVASDEGETDEQAEQRISEALRQFGATVDRTVTVERRRLQRLRRVRRETGARRRLKPFARRRPRGALVLKEEDALSAS